MYACDATSVGIKPVSPCFSARETRYLLCIAAIVDEVEKAALAIGKFLEAMIVHRSDFARPIYSVKFAPIRAG